MQFTIFVRLYLYEYLDGYFSVKSQVDVEYETPQSGGRVRHAKRRPALRFSAPGVLGTNFLGSALAILAA